MVYNRDIETLAIGFPVGPMATVTHLAAHSRILYRWLVTENETPLLSYSIYFYGRTTYIVITVEPHMKPVSEYTETDL